MIFGKLLFLLVRCLYIVYCCCCVFSTRLIVVSLECILSILDDDDVESQRSLKVSKVLLLHNFMNMDGEIVLLVGLDIVADVYSFNPMYHMSPEI